MRTLQRFPEPAHPTPKARCLARAFVGYSQSMAGRPQQHMTAGKPADDELLVRAAAGGDKDAFEQIVRRYEALVYAVAIGRLGRPDEAEEMVQAVFVAAYESLHRLQHPFNLGSWLARIATNLSLNRLRVGRREVSLAEVSEEGLPRSEDVAVRVQEAMIGEEMLSEVLDCLGGLPEPNRIAIGLRYLSELSHEQISRILEAPRSTVRSRIHEGLKMLRKRLARHMKT